MTIGTTTEMTRILSLLDDRVCCRSGEKYVYINFIHTIFIKQIVMLEKEYNYFDVAMTDIVEGHVERVKKTICGHSGMRKGHITYIRYVRNINIAA